MKVVCDGCRAKYQIPDERVAGKKLKIRCRRCASMIVLRGDLMEPQAQGGQIVGLPTASLVPPASVVPERPSLAPAEDAEWHAISGGSQAGPFSAEELAMLLDAGELSWDDYVWRDGLGDWIPSREADELIRAVESLQQGQAEPAGEEDDAPTRMFASSPSLAPEPVQPSPAAQAHFQPSYAASSAPQADQGLSFGGYGEQTPVSSPEVAPSPSYSMTGGRNENSVLFSAQSLGSLAESEPQQQAGYASGDGSGLIDIRALASIASQSAPPSNGAAPRGDELLGMANQTGAFATLDSLAPVSGVQRGRSSNTLPLAILAGSAMVAVAAFAAVYITRMPVEGAAEGTVAVAAAAQPIAAPAAAPGPEPAPEPVAEEEPAAEEEAAAEEPEAEEVAAEEEAADEPAEAAAEPAPTSRATPKKRTARKARAKKRAARDKAAPAAKVEADKPADQEGASIDDLLLSDSKKPEPAAAAPSEEAKPAEPAKDRSIDDLLETAVSDKKPSGSSRAKASAVALPETPDRQQVIGAMKGVQGAVKQCAASETPGGTAKVAITVSGSSGKVTGARVTGVAGPVGSCIARAVRTAKFPKFSKPTFSIDYPFRL